jgi:hypothetical protein
MTKHLLLCLLFLQSSGNPLASQDQLYGRWIQESSNGVPLNTSDRYLTLTFMEDGTFELVVVTGRLSGNPITETLKGTYFVSGSQLTTLFADGASNSVGVSFDGGRMTFKDAAGNTTTYLR